MKPLAILFLSFVCLAHADDALDQKLHQALKAANPDYANEGKFVYREGKLHTLNLMRSPGLHDLSPLGNFPLESVQNVILYNSVNVSDLSPLKTARLTALNTERCAKISDLSPLEGMPLAYFRMYACPLVKDLSPLRGMPLHHLDIGLNPIVEDISALEGMQLTDLRLDNCPKLTSIAVIEGMPLKLLSVFGCTGVEDFAPLLGLPLESLFFSPELLSKAELQAVRKMKTLKILGTGWKDLHSKQTPEEFWAKFDRRPDS